MTALLAAKSRATCHADHQRCHQPWTRTTLERGCGCCPCVRTTARNPDCFGCTLPGCPCFVPWQDEP